MSKTKALVIGLAIGSAAAAAYYARQVWVSYDTAMDESRDSTKYRAQP